MPFAVFVKTVLRSIRFPRVLGAAERAQ